MVEAPHDNEQRRPQELAKFSDLAHRWWDPTASSGRCTRSTRCGWTGSTNWRLAGKRVLDVGCGGGILRGHGASGAERAGHRPGHQAAGRGAAACAGVGCRQHRVPRGRGRERWPPSARQLRRRDLHGDAGARARSRVGGAACAAGQARAAGCSSPPSTATPRPSCSPSSAPSTCSSCCPRARTSTRASSAPANWPLVP
jgi:hypothetical protein